VVEKAKVQAPSIYPDPDYYVEREGEVKKVEDFIERTEGAVIGLTGVRGSGKTTVMEKAIVRYKDSYFTLKISSPTGYDEKEFFITVFTRICEEVSRRIEKEFGMRTSIEKLAERKRRKYLILFSTAYALPVTLLVVYAILYRNLFELVPLDFFFFLAFCPIFILGSLVTVKFYTEFLRVRNFQELFGLYLLTQDTLETLKYERTISYQAEAEAGITKYITSIFRMGKELKTRPFTLPGLTSEYNDYVSNVIDVFGGKAIICIDELDKIADPEEVKKLLRGIKGAIFQKNCYYLISISEDAVRSFRTRISSERDMLESTFDEMITLDRIDLNIARKIARQWLGHEYEEELPEETKKTIDVIGVLSGGVPRELIRNLREVLIARENDVVPIEAWEILFRKKVCDFRNEAKLAQISEDVKTEVYEIANKLMRDDLSAMKTGLREKLEKIYRILEPLNLSNKKGEEKMFQEINKLRKGILGLIISALVSEYLEKGLSNDERVLHILLKAYSMLPYSQKLSNKYINDAITALDA
jgi:hypothetical protein